MPRPSNPHGLSDRQWRFVQEYLIDLNATAAYQRAGYAARPASARANAARMLANASIEQAIAAERKQLATRLTISAERVLQEYARLAFADMRQVAAWDSEGVEVLDSKTLTDDAAATIAEVFEDTREITTDTGIVRLVKKRVKLHEKLGALNSLAKHLHLFTDDEQDLPDIHVHIHSARDRLRAHLLQMTTRTESPPDAPLLNGPPGESAP